MQWCRANCSARNEPVLENNDKQSQIRNMLDLCHRSLPNVPFIAAISCAERASHSVLPLLEAMMPSLARASDTPTPRRFFGICNNLGLLPDMFFPAAESAGSDYQLSPYLEHLADHRQDFTVFSGVWHPDVDGGHPADNCFPDRRAASQQRRASATRFRSTSLPQNGWAIRPAFLR